MRMSMRLFFILLLACALPAYASAAQYNMSESGNEHSLFTEESFAFKDDRLSLPNERQWKYALGIQSGDMHDVEALGLSPSGGFGLHGLLGWSTVATAITTVVMGFVHPGDVHCGLAIASTSLAALACASGIYGYGFPTGDTKYTAHAMMGMLSTAGFATSIFLADRKSHAVLGGIAGVVFTVTVGVTYF